DGIRDGHVTGVQTCALPISVSNRMPPKRSALPVLGSTTTCAPLRAAGSVEGLISVQPFPSNDHMSLKCLTRLWEPARPTPPKIKIGRASCRERVEVSGGGRW